MAITTTPIASTTQTAQAGDGVDITAPRARQGYPGRRIVWILAASLLAVVVAFMIAFAFNPTTPAASKNGSAQVKDPAAAASFHAPNTNSKVPG